MFELVHSKSSFAREVEISHPLNVIQHEIVLVSESSQNYNLNFYADVLDEDNDTSDSEKKKLSSVQSGYLPETFLVTNYPSAGFKAFRLQNQRASIYLALLKVLRL